MDLNPPGVPATYMDLLGRHYQPEEGYARTSAARESWEHHSCYDYVRNSRAAVEAAEQTLNAGTWNYNAALSSVPYYGVDPVSSGSSRWIYQQPFQQQQLQLQPLLSLQPWTWTQTDVAHGGRPAPIQLRGAKRQRLWSKKKKNTITDSTMQRISGSAFCSVCQLDCLTDFALQQHLSGKRHRKRVEQQEAKWERATVTMQAVVGGGTNADALGASIGDVFEQMWLQVSSMGKTSKATKKRTRVAKEERDDVENEGEHVMMTQNQKLQGEFVASVANEGEVTFNQTLDNYTAKKDQGIAIAMPAVDPMSIGGNAAPTSRQKSRKESVMPRCELCSIECNSEAAFLSHLKGKKHAFHLRSLKQQG